VARRGGLGPILVAGLLVGVLTGCSDDSDGPAARGTRTPSASATTAYPSGAPAGTVLTEPGSELSLAESATIAWQPRQDVVGTLQISVDSVEPTTFRKSFRDWRVDATTRTFSPYFVRAHVSNIGITDLGGFPVPVYGEDSADALVEPAVFKETFKPCHPSALPAPFGPGASTTVCLVFLVPAHGQLVGAAFRPTQDFDPIVWRPASASPAASSTTSPTTSPATSPTTSPTS